MQIPNWRQILCERPGLFFYQNRTFGGDDYLNPPIPSRFLLDTTICLLRLQFL